MRTEPHDAKGGLLFFEEADYLDLAALFLRLSSLPQLCFKCAPNRPQLDGILFENLDVLLIHGFEQRDKLLADFCPLRFAGAFMWGSQEHDTSDMARNLVRVGLRGILRENKGLRESVPIVSVGRNTDIRADNASEGMRNKYDWAIGLWMSTVSSS